MGSNGRMRKQKKSAEAAIVEARLKRMREKP
jgi:hypothetical protein